VTRELRKISCINCSFFVSPLHTYALIRMTHTRNLLFLFPPLYYCLDFSCMVILDQCHMVQYSIWQHIRVHGAAQWPHPSPECFLFIFMVPIQSAFHSQSWRTVIICQCFRTVSNAFGVSFEMRDDSNSICCPVWYEAHTTTRILFAQFKCLHSELWQFQ
jgi:hypothetical protein